MTCQRAFLPQPCSALGNSLFQLEFGERDSLSFFALNAVSPPLCVCEPVAGIVGKGGVCIPWKWGQAARRALANGKIFEENLFSSCASFEDSSQAHLISVFRWSFLVNRKWPIAWDLLKSCPGSCCSLLTHKLLVFQDIEYIRAHYNIEDFIGFDHHQPEEHGHLCHFVLNPVVHHYTKYFLKEILRLGHKSSLYYPVYPEYVQGKVRKK